LLYRNRKSFYENYWKPQIGLDKKIKSILDKNALDKKFEKIKDFKEDSRRRITELD
jgi:hypothetical protein